MGEFHVEIGGRESPGPMDDLHDVSLLDFVQLTDQLVVGDSTSLRDIIDVVERRFQLTNAHLISVTIVFGHELHEFCGHILPDVHADHLTVTDDTGALRWWVPQGEWDRITFANLLDSHAAGLIGDPSEIRILKTGQWGNGIPPMDWPQFLTVLEHIAAMLGLAGMAAKGVSVLKTRYENWRDRRARPEDVLRFVTGQVSWDRNDLAKRLDVSRDDARAILNLFGFEYDRSSQLYVRSEDGRTARVRNELKDAFEKYED